MISELIDKLDNFEVIRDKIAVILATEFANQQILASNAGRNPADWKARIFSERSNPWEQWLEAPPAGPSPSPLINVWFDGENFDPSGSNIVERQKTTATFNIDCYGYGLASDNPDGGHNPGDKEAAFEVQRTLRLARNILMAAEYTYLGLRGVVWQRWPQSIQIFQPQTDGHFVQQIVGARMAFRVIFNEFSPQIPLVTLELVAVDIKRAETGEIIAEADYSYI